jgi:Asp-tRNA(Asn)/Glu-tRNA(Gln) amidotransferase C subunit
MEGTGWLLPKAEPFATKIKDILNSVEEMEGTANLYSVTDFSGTQEQRAINRFQQEREKEYGELIKECHKVLRHIERECRQQEYNFEEVQELEGDLEKIKRWFSEARERDFRDVAPRKEVAKLIAEGEAGLAAFTRETYERTRKPDTPDGINAEDNGGDV